MSSWPEDYCFKFELEPPAFIYFHNAAEAETYLTLFT